MADALAALAGTPDDDPGVEPLLETIAQLTVDRVGGLSYASITSMADAGYVTVAASSEVARAIDAVQYQAQDGPCVRALEQQEPMAVPDVTTTMIWPDFARVARRYGLNATMSAPLYTGSGACVAVLNMHGRELATMAPLIGGVWSIYRPQQQIVLPGEQFGTLDAGGLELLAGLTQALAVREVIQQAIHLVRACEGCTAREAYLWLVQRAAASGANLAQTAARQLASGL
ncbi:GAF and ANTAR domain-containing protein [Actinoplanes sp. NPDC049548]|uniref:GAF and ANTAR domain-containing protein n=1 Tax=Actinoplanes sp. NPDC049548 TaxID=3155152 RepID=UPI003415CBBA